MRKLSVNKQLLALGLISILAVFLGGMIAPIEMRFLSQVTGNNSLASFAFTFGTIASVLGSIAISHWANKHGRKKTLFIFLFISIFIPIIYASIESALAAYGVKFAWAFSLAGSGTILWALLQEEVAAKENNLAGTFFGILYSIQAGAGSVGVLFGGFLTDKFGFVTVFYTISFFYLFQFIILFLYFRGSAKNSASVKTESLSPKGDLLAGAKFIWINRELRARFILLTTFGISWSTKAILYPIILFSITSSNTATGAIMGTQGIVAMIALPYIGRMVDKVGYSKVLWIGYTVLGIALLTFSLSPFLWIIWIAAGLVALGEACNGPAMAALEVKNIPNHLRNSVIAIQNIYSTFVEVVTTSLTGLLLAFWMPQRIMFIMSILIFISLIIAFQTTKAEHNEKELTC